ncbi:DUF2199 domain-containing protein [Luteibacter aegosomatissinici]|uniref:DUF2199 domain-containing protein n=1 Tax=Luteibacter aegosomatissinici TaxID=2911539 RepID=UPI001FFBE4FD|nr:DUF2199 domain-containing protein [Luteibacter aegosomatissinici]UPG93315.1 DUF2199 domain-containing protein [Luteibacter aegosomatissinici]
MAHDSELFELAYHRPDAVVAMDDDERAQRVRESNDICRIDNARFFLRGILPLPVHDRADGYMLGVWVEVSEGSFSRIHKLWTDPDQADEPAFDATLANEVRHHPGSLGLAVTLQLTGPTTRPSVFLVDDGHPLAVEQREGISFHRATEYTYGQPDTAV